MKRWTALLAFLLPALAFGQGKYTRIRTYTTASALSSVTCVASDGGIAFVFNDSTNNGVWQCTGTNTWVHLGTGAGGVTSVATGAGLTGGPITSTGTIAVANGGIASSMLANNLTLPGTTSGTFSGALTGNVTGNVSGTAATITGALAVANTPLSTSQDILYRNGAALGALSISTVTPSECLGNNSGVWGSFPCSGGTGSGINITINAGSPLAGPANFENGTGGNAIDFLNPSASNVQATIHTGTVTGSMLASGLTLAGTTTGTFSGNLTGNVTGNVSGTAATITGSLATANTPLTASGDILYLNGSTLSALPIGTLGSCLGVVAGPLPGYIACGAGGGGIGTLNGLTAATQSFATGTTGTDFNITSTTATHTFNLPTVSGTARGLVTSAQKAGWDAKAATVTCAANTFANVIGTVTSACAAAVTASSAPANRFATAISAAGALTYTQPTFGNLSGTAAVNQGGTGATTLATNALIKGNGASPVSASLAIDDGTTLSYSGTGGLSAAGFQGTGAGPALLKLPAGTFATLIATYPCVTAQEGSLAAVNDSATAIWGAVISGGGTNHVLAFCNGASWTVH